MTHSSLPRQRLRRPATAVVVLLVASAGLFSAVGPALDPARIGAGDPVAPISAPKALADMAVAFVRNDGQWRADTRFAATSGHIAATFEADGMTLAVDGGSASFDLRFEGASRGVELLGEQARGARYNYYMGSDPANWRSDVPGFASLLYHGLYAGVDARVREGDAGLEYDLLLAPGADLDQVVVAVGGAGDLRLAADGSLAAEAETGSLRQPAPIAWQSLPDGTRRSVESRFRLLEGSRYGFEVSGSDPTLPLVIDPGLEWATYLGGNGDETIAGIAMFGGDVIVAGSTLSPDFPSSVGDLVPWGLTPYVARLDGSGTELEYATFFGGSGNNPVLDMAVDSAGRPVVVGNTTSLDFPTTPGAFDRTPGDGSHGDYDAFVIKFDATGGGPVFGTYLGGSPNSANYDEAWTVGVDSGGSVVVAGITTSTDLPTTAGAYDRTYNGGRDLFVARLDPTGSQLTYSSFLGGGMGEEVYDMAVDPQGFVNLTGRVHGSGTPAFPTTSNGFDRTYDNVQDGYLARLKLDGGGAADLRYSTFLGGAQWTDAGTGLAFDPNAPETVTVAGWTRSGDFPTTAGALGRTHFVPIDGSMATVTRFRFPTGASPSLVWSTFYGSAGNQHASDVVIDTAGNAIIVGGSAVGSPQVTEGAYDRVPGVDNLGRSDGYVAHISADGSRLLYASLIGGGGGDTAMEAAYGGGASVVVAGLTNSSDFPVTPGSFDTVYAADGAASGGSSPGTLADDVFIAKMTLQSGSGSDVTAPSAPDLRAPAGGATFTAPTTITFDWSDVADTSGIEAYHFQLSPTSDFIEPVGLAGTFHEAWLPTSVAVVPRSVSNVGLQYWRVQVLDRAHNLGPWSAVRTVTVNSPTPPPAPVLSSPPNNGVFGPGNVTFAWLPAPTATSYVLQVDTRSDFTNPNRIWIRGIPGTQHTVSLTTAQRYWWRVAAENESITGSGWSAVRTLEIRSGSPPAPTPTPSPPPSGGPPGGIATGVARLSISPDSVSGGATTQGTVTLNGAAPSGGAVVALASTYPDRATVPPSVTVPAGSSSATFTITAGHLSFASSVAITGEFGGVTQGEVVVVFADDPVLELHTITVGGVSYSWPGSGVNPGGPVILGGATLQGSVSFGPGWVAGPRGAVITLGTTNKALVSVPPRLTIPPGGNSASFTVTTQSVSTATKVAVFASRSLTLGVMVELLPPGALSTLSLNPTTVVGGNPSQGTVILSGAAPAGGVVVALSSINTQWATVPPSVTVPAGASSATFTVTTKPNTTGEGQFTIIYASSGGVERQAVLNVNPGPAGGPTPTPTATPTPTPTPMPTPTPTPTPTSTPTSPPPTGSTGLLSATTSASASGGDGNGFETTAQNALADDGLYAVDLNSGDGSSTSCTSSSKDKHVFRDYGVSVPIGSTIKGVEVRLDAKVDSTSSSPKMCVQLSWNGGSSWTSAKSTPTLSTAEGSYILGATTDTWGRTWAIGDFSNATFRVRVIDVSSSSSRDFSLDWVAVRVSH